MPSVNDLVWYYCSRVKRCSWIEHARITIIKKRKKGWPRTPLLKNRGLGASHCWSDPSPCVPSLHQNPTSCSCQAVHIAAEDESHRWAEGGPAEVGGMWGKAHSCWNPQALSLSKVNLWDWTTRDDIRVGLLQVVPMEPFEESAPKNSGRESSHRASWP